MKRLNFKVILTLLLTTIGTLIGALSFSLMWFARMNAMDLNIGGSVLSQYFDSGEGTEDDPFIITRPKHWENLVWLHNNVSTFYQAISDGTQDDSDNEKGYYFQVGKLNPELDDGILYVYDYTDTGLINPTNNTLSSRILNLKGSDSLIPIGSCTKPFMGEVISDGITISGFDVLGFEDVNYNLVQDAGEKGFNDIGIFGYVGRNSYINGLYFNDFIIHLGNAEADRPNALDVVHNSSYHDSNKDGDLDTVYAGYIAGHIHYSTTLSQVYINNCTIDGGSSAVSGFGYFGVVENEDGNLKPTPLETISETKQSGDGNSFGGSVDMMGVYDRLARIYTSSPASSTTQFVSGEIFIANELDDSKYLFSTTTSKVNAWSGNVSYRYYSTEAGGVFNFPDDNDNLGSTANNIYQCLYGESTHYTKTITTYTYIDDWYSCFFIQSGGTYLNNRYYTDIRAESNADSAAGWNFDGSNHLYTKVFDTTYYLNRNNYSLTLGTTANTTWTKTGDDEIYTVINGVNHYIDFEDTWHLSPYKDRYLISDGNTNYLKLNNTTISNVTSEANATRLIFSNYSGATTTIGYFNTNDNNIYYLGSGNGGLTLSTTSTTWNKDGNNYYIVIQGIKHYIVFENNQWLLMPEDGVRISDGNNHYLTGNNTTIGNSNTLNGGTVWHYSSSTGDTQIFNITNGTKYYLTVTNNALAISTTAATWHRSGNSIYYTSGSKDYYLVYENGWNVILLDYFTISDSTNTNFLVCNGANSFSNTTNVNNATHFYFSNTTGDAPSGTINCVVNGNIYYLNNSINNTTKNGTLQTSTTSTTTCNWSNDGISIYQYDSPYTYYLEFANNAWAIRTYSNGYYITDGTNYMVLTGTNPTNTTNIANATIFFFTNTSGTYPSGNIYANVNGTNRYLRDNNGTLTSATTASTTTTGYSWSYDGNNLKSNQTTNRYLYYSGSAWALSASNVIRSYYIASGTTYLGTDGSSITKTQTEWLIPGKGTNPTNVYTVINGTNYYLSIGTGNVLTVSTTPFSWNNTTANRLRGVSNTRYIRYSNNTWSANNTATNLTFTEVSSYPYPVSYTSIPTNNIRSTISTLRSIPSPTISNTNYNASKNLITNASYQQDYSMNFFNGQLQNCEKDVINNVKSGNPTYFPLRVDKDENTGAYAEGYAASDKNTGYMISGSNLDNSSSTDTSQKKWGDIRVAGWAISNINGSYSNNKFTTVYTVDGDTRATRALTTAETADADYQHALEEFGNTLRGQSKVYGVHFMDAAISKEHTIRANQAKILGQTYYNYELPEDSIDFNVYQRGKISFFAGEYFSNNNAFFSLHRIFRDANNDISEIKEISEVYWHAQRHDKANYIYKFSDNTFTNADGTYTGSKSLDGQYSATPVFKTEWITQPSQLSTTSSRLYYFAIPCNKGEYALGSVNGRTGAYLCYLDIAANGGDTILENIKNADTASTFPVDFREANETTPHSILQLGANLPDSANPNDLSITVSFDNSPETCLDTPYSDGVYKIYVVNRTGVDLELSVLVIDDDDDLYNDYNYAYIIYYTNENHTNEIIQGQTFNDDETALIPVDYWKRLAIFVIPTNGDAGESDYS